MAKFFSKNGLWFNYLICINSFAFARYILQIIINHIFKDFQIGMMGWVYLVNNVFYILLFLCGCLAGYLINKRTILHSSLATAIAVMFSVFLVGISNYKDLLPLFAIGTILGGLGGVTALLVRKFCQSRQNKYL